MPITVEKAVIDKASEWAGATTVTVTQDEGIRPGTTYEALAGLKTVWHGPAASSAGGHQRHRSQRQPAVGRCLRPSADGPRDRGGRGQGHPGIYRGFQSAGCVPDEMGINPVFAVPKLLERAGLSVADIGLWELNESFASQCRYCRDTLGIDPERYNVNGGVIAVGHPFGMTGSRLVGHALLKGRRRRVRWVAVSMCTAGGMGAAGLFGIV